MADVDIPNKWAYLLIVCENETFFLLKLDTTFNSYTLHNYVHMRGRR